MARDGYRIDAAAALNTKRLKPNIECHVYLRTPHADGEHRTLYAALRALQSERRMRDVEIQTVTAQHPTAGSLISIFMDQVFRMAAG